MCVEGNVVAPRVGDDEYWTRVAQIHAVELNATAMAAVLGFRAATVSHYVKHPPEGFPAPATRGWRHQWSLAQAYSYLRQRKPLQANTIPRCFPREDHEAVAIGATLLSTDQMVISPTGPFASVRDPLPEAVLVAHYWQPADGGPPLAVLYPAEPGFTMSRWSAVQVAAAGARHWSMHYKAVAVVTDELRPRPGTDQDAGAQAAVVVCEVGDELRCPPGFEPPELREAMRGHSLDPVSAYEIGWFDLAYLLRADLPWWPPALRDADTMLRWTPGRAVEHLPPEDRRYRHWALPMLSNALQEARPSSTATVRNLLARADRRIQESIYPRPTDAPDLPADAPAAPGIVQAAAAQFTQESPTAPLASAEAGLLLRQPYPYPEKMPPGVREAVGQLWRLKEIRQQIGQTTTLSRFAAIGPLCREWLDRLEPLPQPLIGHVCIAELSRLIAEQPLIDPLNPACWVVRDPLEKTAVYAVGTSLPSRGVLTEIECDSGHAGFFRDSEGLVWPLPAPWHTGLPWEQLAQTIVALHANAAADTSRIGRQYVPAALEHAVQQHNPWSLTQAEVDAIF